MKTTDFLAVYGHLTDEEKETLERIRTQIRTYEARRGWLRAELIRSTAQYRSQAENPGAAGEASEPMPGNAPVASTGLLDDALDEDPISISLQDVAKRRARSIDRLSARIAELENSAESLILNAIARAEDRGTH